MDVRDDVARTLGRAEKTIAHRIESALHDLEQARDATMKELRDKFGAMEALKDGAGAIMERAEHVLTTTFRANWGSDATRMLLNGLRLSLPVHDQRIQVLDDPPYNWEHGPSLRPNTTYRVFVIFEAIDQGESS